MKLLFLIGDGMGDWPHKDLDGKTPLEAARTPAMDALAVRGVCGTIRTVPQGMPPGSDVANMALLGFDPATKLTGRGPIEAAAMGLDLAPDDLVFRANLVSVTAFNDAGTMLDYAAGHISGEQAARCIERLQAVLADETAFELHQGVQYRHILVWKGGAASCGAKVHIRPPHDILDQPMAEDLAEFAVCPELQRVVTLAAQELAGDWNDSQANAIWPWGQGRPLILPDFSETFGLRGCCVSAVDLVKGLGRAADMHVPDIPGATGLLDTDYEAKVAAATAFLNKGGDFVYVHVEAPDEEGHGGVAARKVEAIERFDARVVAPLVEAFPDAAFVVTCDHFTPLEKRTHTPDPVPFALAWPGAEASGRAFTEAEATATMLRIEPGHGFLPWVLERLRGAS